MNAPDKNHLPAELNLGNMDTTETGVETEPDLENLRAYMQVKLALADQLRIIRQGLNALGRESAEQQCAELMVKLAEDRFVLAVAGQFKRGKSSLMNAIIGRRLLPTGVLPLTSAITILKYGPAEKMIVNRGDTVFPDEYPISELADYVTEKGNPDNRKNVRTVLVELPVPFLQRGVEFTDTPGVGSAISANTTTTYGFLPQCDAVLFVTAVDTPMTSIELELLREIKGYVSRIFFVVNKIDLVTDDERSEVLEYVTQTICKETGNKEMKIFPVSSGLALSARMSGDTALYKKSGLKSLEDALASFLSMEKSVGFLAAIASEAIRLTDLALETLQSDPREAAALVAGARLKLEVLHQNILAGRMAVPTAGDMQTMVSANPLPENTNPESQPVPPPLTAGVTGTEMIKDLQTRTCPVCHHIAKEASEFFARWQYRLSGEERAQVSFATELGFCPLHTWQLIALSSPYGASIGYARLAEEIALLLKRHYTDFSRGTALRHLVHNSGNCRVCKLLREAERKYIGQLSTLINGSPGRAAYRHSQGACLSHLGMLLDTVSSEEDRRFLLSHSAGLFEQDAEDMRTYAMKRDALRRSLQNRNEEDAYRRAIIRIVGDRSVCMPWVEDGEI